MTLNSPEGTVRVAWAADAPGIARVQTRAWRTGYGDILPTDVLAALDEAAFEARWRESLGKPGDARNRVLVALGPAERIVGFAVTGPCADPDADPIADGELEALHVDPDETRQGHGSRLLHAAVDTLRADGFTRAVSWLFSTDDVLRGFLTDAGWAPDGAHRELDMYGDGAVRMKQIRLHCAVAEANGRPDPETNIA
ncbi:MAG TPA: GNAT family N-acetyltransferase [Actinopolymorphaceae bacterium]